MISFSQFARCRMAVVLGVFVFAAASSSGGQSSSPAGYTLSFPSPAVNYAVSFTSPEQHLVHVKIIIPAGGHRRELQLPVWNSLYQVRDFSQYVNWIRAADRDGKPLVVHERRQEPVAD